MPAALALRKYRWLPFTIQANYAGRYWRGAAPPMFNRPLRTAAPLCGSAAAPRGIFDSQRGLVTPAKGRRDCYRRHVRRGRSHFCDGKPSRARETRAIPQMSTRAKMTSLQICRPEITCDFRQICQRGGLGGGSRSPANYHSPVG